MLLRLCLILYLVSLCLYQSPIKAELKTIQLITMGGAITGTQKDALSGKFKLSSRSAETLVAGNIEILELADIKFKELYNIPSQEIQCLACTLLD